MDNIKIVQNLSNFQVLYARWLERNTDYTYDSYRDLDRIIMDSKANVTYRNAIENLKLKALEHDFMEESILELEEDIINSDISHLRLGSAEDFSEIEIQLDRLRIKSILEYTELTSIKSVSKRYNIPVTTIKNACLSERLLNTKKVGNLWLVNAKEVLQYFKRGKSEYYNGSKTYIFDTYICNILEKRVISEDESSMLYAYDEFTIDSKFLTTPNELRSADLEEGFEYEELLIYIIRPDEECNEWESPEEWVETMFVKLD